MAFQSSPHFKNDDPPPPPKGLKRIWFLVTKNIYFRFENILFIELFFFFFAYLKRPFFGLFFGKGFFFLNFKAGNVAHIEKNIYFFWGGGGRGSKCQNSFNSRVLETRSGQWHNFETDSLDQVFRKAKRLFPF